MLFKARKLLSCLSHPAYRKALLYAGVAAGVEHREVLASLGRVQSVLDVGANTGQFALVASAVWPDASLYSFEPLSAPARKYMRVHGSNPRVKLIRAALGADRAVLNMHVSARDDSSSLLPISDLQVALHPGTHEVGLESVTVAPLEDLLDVSSITEPALLKIDVQGYELQVLQGCAAALRKFQYIYVECSFVEFYRGQALGHEVDDWLAQRGFKKTAQFNPAYDKGALVQADNLYERV